MAKAEIKTRPTRLSVAKYLSAIQGPERRKDCKILCTLMTAETGAKPVLWGTALVGFGKKPLKYASGRELEWPVMGFASRKDSISLYLTCSLDQSPIPALLKKLGPHKRGVGCLYIKRLADVDMATLKALIALKLDY